MNYNYWFFYILGFIICIVGLKTKNKKLCIFFSLLCLFLIVSSAYPPKSGVWTDLNNYEVSYKYLTAFYPFGLSNDWLFYNLEYLCKMIGLTFMQCKAVIMFCCVLLLYIVLNRYSYNVVLFGLFFFQMHLIFNVSLILRNSLGFLVLLLGLKYLIDGTIRYRKLKYIICVIIAAQFHSMIYLYLPLVFVAVNIDFWKKYRKLIILFLAILFLLLISEIRSGRLITYLANLAGGWLESEKYVSYATVRSRWAWLSVVLIWILTVVNSFVVSGVLRKNRNAFVRREMKTSLSNFKLIRAEKTVDYSCACENLNKLILISSAYAPLSIFTLHMARLLKYISLINIIYMALAWDLMKNKKILRVCIFLSTMVITLLWLYFDMFIYKGYRPDLLDEFMVNGKWFWIGE